MNTILLVLSKLEDEQPVEGFCGTVIYVDDGSSGLPSLSSKTVYLCGDIANADKLENELQAARRVFVIRELSHNLDARVAWPIVDVGQLPILVHGVGVLYRRFFDPALDYFNRIRADHVFQSLTESSKPGQAHRTGIYLTPVEQHGEELHFRLLRCSSNLSGPTEDFSANDRRIVEALNEAALDILENQAPLNHVLAQIYWNTPATDAQKQTKAKIKGHADKTKDMPANGIMAFCTFYDGLDKLQPLDADPFDYGYRGTSGLTRLHFRLKPPVEERPGCSLATNCLHAAPRLKFSVTLYPGSVFFMPLSTNRLYTHEIRPAGLDAALLPTRLGYVVRCSAREAVHRDGHTFLRMDGKLVELQPATPEGMGELRRLYAEENLTDAFVDYGDGFLFSMNAGDYAKPRVVT